MSEHDFEDNDTQDDAANPFDAFREKYGNMTISELVTKMREVQTAHESATLTAKLIGKELDFLRLALIPERCEEQNVGGMKVEGVGRLNLTSDMYVSVKSGKVNAAMEWLRDIGKGDIIKEQISSSSLKAIVKKMTIDGKEIPSDLINATAFTRASITKA